jgi:hypothetical protein
MSFGHITRTKRHETDELRQYSGMQMIPFVDQKDVAHCIITA